MGDVSVGQCKHRKGVKQTYLQGVMYQWHIPSGEREQYIKRTVFQYGSMSTVGDISVWLDGSMGDVSQYQCKHRKCVLLSTRAIYHCGSCAVTPHGTES